MAQYATSRPVSYFILSFPLGKDSVEYFSYQVENKTLCITLIKRGGLVYLNGFSDIQSTVGYGTGLPVLPSLSEEQIKAMTKQPLTAYSSYDLYVPHQGGT